MKTLPHLEACEATFLDYKVIRYFCFYSFERFAKMSFSTDQTLESARQLIRQACLYNKSTSYGYHAPFTSHNLYNNGKGIDALQARKLTGAEQSSVTAAVYGHNGYQQNLLASNEVNAFQFIPMAPIATCTPQQPYYTNIQSWISPFQATTDYTGLLDATNPATRPKPAHPFYWRKRGNSTPTEGMTRTRDKYRVVYTEKQRVGLEKEFKTNKFITMQTKMEISKELDLSERQVNSNIFIHHGTISSLLNILRIALSCQPRVTVTSCFVYKVMGT